jgi:hypothetical protein
MTHSRKKTDGFEIHDHVLPVAWTAEWAIFSPGGSYRSVSAGLKSTPVW